MSKTHISTGTHTLCGIDLEKRPNTKHVEGDVRKHPTREADCVRCLIFYYRAGGH